MKIHISKSRQVVWLLVIPLALLPRLVSASLGDEYENPVSAPGPSHNRNLPMRSSNELRSNAEISQATFVDLDFSKFPSLPRSDVPVNAIFVSSTNGDDESGSGSESSPWQSIVAAVRAALPGDTIVVSGGTYREAWEPWDYRALVLAIDDLTIMAAPGETVRLLPASAAIKYGIIVNCRNLSLHGLYLEGFATIGVLFDATIREGIRNRNIAMGDMKITGSDEAISVWTEDAAVDGLLLVDIETDASVDCGSGSCSSWRLERVSIQAKDQAPGTSRDGFAVESGDNILVVDSEILGAASDGLDMKASRVVVLNSRVEDVGDNGIKLWQGGDVINSVVRRGWADPVWVEEGRFRFLHSVIGFGSDVSSFRGYSLVCGYDERKPMQVEIVNSIIANPSGGVWINPETSQLKIHNTLFYTADGSEILVHGNFEATFQDPASLLGLNQRYGSGNLAADPQLDQLMRPAPSSPAIDAGVELVGEPYPHFDFTGSSRVVGSAPDIGAYEQ